MNHLENKQPEMPMPLGDAINETFGNSVPKTEVDPVGNRAIVNELIKQQGKVFGLKSHEDQQALQRINQNLDYAIKKPLQ